MTSKTLSSTNRYLKKSSANAQIITNVASSTAIETGKQTSTYVNHGAKPGRSVGIYNPTLQKK